MSIATSIPRAIAAAAVRPIILDEDGAITGVGTAHLLVGVTGNKFSIGIPEGSAAASSEYVEIAAGNGVTVATPKETKRIDTAGNVLSSSAGGGAGGGGDTVGFTAFEITKALVQDIHEYAGNPWQIAVQVGENVTSAQDFTAYIIGTLGGVEISPTAETFTTFTFDVTGGKAYALDGVLAESALAWAPAEFTQPGGETVTFDPLLEADVAADTYTGSGAASGLLSGRAVIK